MKKVVDCADVKTEGEFWQAYIRDAQPEVLSSLAGMLLRFGMLCQVAVPVGLANVSCTLSIRSHSDC